MGIKVSISEGNSKMGSIRSVSLPAIKTCIVCDCNKICYANRLANFRKSVGKSYENNFKILTENAAIYWQQVSAAVSMSRFFRFHVSGDIPDKEYFNKMIDVSTKNPHCEILCFTKKYGIVNDYLEKFSYLPQNLHIIFSAWVGLKMVNPFLLPEAHVRYSDGTTTASDGAIECGGNCTECAMAGEGCWTLQNGEQVIFNQH